MLHPVKRKPTKKIPVFVGVWHPWKTSYDLPPKPLEGPYPDELSNKFSQNWGDTTTEKDIQQTGISSSKPRIILTCLLFIQWYRFCMCIHTMLLSKIQLQLAQWSLFSVLGMEGSFQRLVGMSKGTAKEIKIIFLQHQCLKCKLSNVSFREGRLKEWFYSISSVLG